MTIQAIIFDIGGVLVRTIDRAPRQALAEQLGTTYPALEELVFGGESGRRAQLGQIDEAEQWAYACQQAGWSVQQVAEFRAQFFAGDRLDEELLGNIRQLRQWYKTGIISNGMNNTRTMIGGPWGMGALFDTIVISSEVGIMKPAPRIFQLAVERLGVQPGEAVFVDDVLENVEAARKVGLFAIHNRDNPQLFEDLRALSVDTFTPSNVPTLKRANA